MASCQNVLAVAAKRLDFLRCYAKGRHVIGNIMCNASVGEIESHVTEEAKRI